ncbi:hypothetical protein [Serratia sp. DD3]|uniref:hypothetical protein n=1 Tax=Serratia sp. DD3 TaxID=1410619 RepID=UPI0003C4DF86|nr:hypothetical protein [Serratia sp. DD3]KEY57333.1 hypothetical protein SRDD_38260 [Serratia sp. DD3]
MNLNRRSKSFNVMIYLCFLMCVGLIMIGLFSYLLKGWLVWNLDEPFPFGKEEIVTILKISLLGVPMGIIFWLFDIR